MYRESRSLSLQTFKLLSFSKVVETGLLGTFVAQSFAQHHTHPQNLLGVLGLGFAVLGHLFHAEMQVNWIKLPAAGLKFFDRLIQ